MTSELAISFLARVTFLLLAALLLDSLLRRKWVLTTAALWNAVLLAIAALPLAMLLVPHWRLAIMPPHPRQFELAATPPTGLTPSSEQGQTSPARDARLPESASHAPHGPGPGDSFLHSSSAAGSVSTSAPGITVIWLLTWIYVAGVMIFLVRLAASWRAAAGLRASAIPLVDRAWIERFDVWQCRLGMQPPVRLLQSDRIDVPMALGVRDRVVVIPQTIAANASRHAIDSIFAHELAHLARGDYAWLLVERVVEAILWLHPLFWIARRRMCFIRERACDEFVVHATGDCDRYAETLLDLASQLTSRQSLTLGLAVLRTSNLSRRLAALEQSEGCEQWTASAATRYSLVAFALASSMLLAMLAVGRAAAEQAAEPGQEKPADQEPKAKGGDPRAISKPPTHKLTVVGKALDADGAPLEGATIFLVSTNVLPKTLGRTTTDRHGHYEFRDAPLPLAQSKEAGSSPTGYFQVFGKAPERAFAWRGMKPLYTLRADGTLPLRLPDGYLEGERIELDLTFAPARAIDGRFINETGEPIAGVKVRLANCDFLDKAGRESHVNYREFWALNQAADLMPNEVSSTSDAQGRFKLPSIPPEMICWLLVEHPDYAHLSLYTATTDRPLDQHDEHPVEKLPLEKTLRATRTIPLEVRRADSNNPVAGVRVTGYQQRASGDAANATSDEMGRLTLKLPPGKYRLVADPTKGDFIRTYEELVVAEAPASQPATLKLLSGCILVLKAIDADTGAGVSGVSFWVEQKVKEQVRRYGVQSNTWYIDNPKSNELGELRAVVPPGQHRYGIGFSPFPDGYEAADIEDLTRGRELDFSAGKTVTVEFKLRRR